jgi:hypothetical protein
VIPGFVRPSQPGDPELLAPRLRQADRNEISAATGERPLEALERGVVRSLQPMTVVGLFGGKERLMAMFGAVRETHDVGAIWMLGSDDLFDRRVPFLRQSRDWFLHTARPFRLVYNLVDVRNTAHIRWLRWCGCVFGRERLAGVANLPFIDFYWEVPN